MKDTSVLALGIGALLAGNPSKSGPLSKRLNGKLKGMLNLMSEQFEGVLKGCGA